MKRHQGRLVRWVAVLAILGLARAAQADDLSNFDLAKLGQDRPMTASEAIMNQREMILTVIQNSEEYEDSYQSPQRTELDQSQAVLSDLMQSNGQGRLVCLVNGDQDCQAKLQTLISEKEKLRAHLNGAKGSEVIDYMPIKGVFQTRDLYPLYTRSDKSGVILYLGVSSNNQRYASVKDILRAVDLIKKDEDGYAHIGVIYLLKF